MDLNDKDILKKIKNLSKEELDNLQKEIRSIIDKSNERLDIKIKNMIESVEDMYKKYNIS